jgi:hypothetical protein
VQRGQRFHCTHHLTRKQPHQRRNDAHELFVSLREVRRPVEFVEKEVRRPRVARVGEQVGIGVLKALLLVTLHGHDALRQRAVGGAQGTLISHCLQMRQDGRFGLVIHRRSATVRLVGRP